jgi:uncharacterized protein (TIGR00297 family)
MDTTGWIIVGVTLALVLLLILSRKLLKPTAIVTGLVAALYVAYLGGVGSFFALILFFLVGEAVTRLIRDKHARKPHGQRSTVNIVGNIGPSMIALTLNPVAFNVMFFASLSAAFADTLSSEIGVLSKDKPLMITTLQPAVAGVDGAVSVLGFLGAALGALVFALLTFVLTLSLYWASLIFIAGLFGSVVDSILGATLQKWGYLDNNTNNFFSALFVGLFFALAF